ncbi:MAG: DMT family transporter [bacterium]|nr:DMT family transporter [bacterium]
MRRERLGLIFILCSITGYAFLPIFASYLRDAGLPPLETVFFRYLLAAPIFIGMALATPPPPPDRPLPRRWLIFLGFCLALQALCAFVGLQYLSAGIYLVLFYTYPAMTALGGLLLGERIGTVGWGALALTLVGVTLTISDFSLDGNPDAWIGVICALVNAALSAVYFVLMGRLLNGQPAATRAGAYAVSGAMIFLGGALAVKTAVDGVVLPQGLEVWLPLVGLVAVSTVLPVFMLNKGLQAAGATRAAIFGTIEPLLTAILAQVILGETMLPIQWAGGVLVVASVILLQLRGTPQDAPQPETVPAQH